ncbi:hypothetical protein BDF21DRAFT_351302 [Thamnidium elegans]|nr:hypothetical protein BDF21DRAFT_351302 [Thamnidium elegans]
MCKKLKTSSMIDTIFVSFKTDANEPIIDRGIDDDKKVLEETDADGNTQGKNIIIGSFLHTHTANVKVSRYVEICLLKKHVFNNTNVEKIVVDSLSHSNKIALFDRKELLNNQ